MSRLNGSRRALLYFIPWTALALGVAGWAEAEEGKIYLLLAASNADSKIGPSCDVDIDNVEQFLMQGSPPGRIVVDKLTDKTDPVLSPQSVVEYYQKRLAGRVGTDDAVIFFYSGHGAFDREQYHYMDLSTGPLPRLQVRDAILALRPQPRLVVVITDCCSFYKDIDKFPPRAAAPNPAVVEALFLRPRGIVDINACSEGQVATGNNQTGGAFTKAWVFEMGRELAKLDVNQDGGLTWHEFFPQLIPTTNANWKDAHPDGVNLGGDVVQKTQIPQAYNLPTDPSDPKPRYSLGVSLLNAIEDGKRIGVVVKAVAPGSPAEKLGLKPDVIIRKIDGKTIRTIRDFDMCLMTSAGKETEDEVEITFRDRTQEMKVRGHLGSSPTR
jgi:hypothetical protein